MYCTKPCVGKLLSFLFVISFLINSNTVKSQVIFTEGFENNFPPAGWSLQNYTPNGNSWIENFSDVNSGSKSAACFPSVANCNAWIFTKPLNLIAGKYYELRYYAKNYASARLKVTMGTSADLSGQTRIIHNAFPANFTFNLNIDTIICDQTGTYYIGFNNYSSANNNATTVIDDITFTNLNFADCSTVSAGTVSSSVNNICYNTTFTITNANATVNAVGLNYAWQKSTDGVIWTNITNGNTYQPSIQVSQSVATYYRLADTCTITGANAVSNALLINMTSFLTCYCTPASIFCVNSMSFSNVTILNSPINNSTGCSNNGYGNYASVGNANVYRNQEIYIQHTIANPNNSYPYTVGVWADWNHNGVFEASEYAENGPFSTSTVNASQILVPSTALPGETRLRLKLKALLSITGDEACTAVNQTGETEDYKITVGDASDCSGAVSAGTVNAVGQTCPNNNFTLTATGATLNQAQMRYAWQKSTDNANWVNINNNAYLVNPITTSINANAYFRLTDTCLASSQVSVSNSILVTANNVFTCYCVPQTSNCTTVGIDSVSFNTIHNASGCGAGGYSNFTSISTTANNGTNLPVYLKVRPSSASQKNVSVYIDFNRNGIFETTELVLNGPTFTNNISGTVTIPFNVAPGETGMRVIVSANTISSGGCPLITNGEIEDYKVILNVATAVSSHFSYYVNQSATGLNNGTSWANAFTSLATAFSLITKGDTIRVAKGVYTPGTNALNSFQLKDSVIIMGGYPDIGNPTDANRNFADYQSIMSGDIGVLNNSLDNIKVILQAINAKGFIVDGFVIENGYAEGSAELGPVNFTGSTGSIDHSVIRKNFNYWGGSAINAINSTVKLSNSFIENNTTTLGSGNGSVFNFSSKSNISMVNLVVAKNKATYVINQFNSTASLLNSTVFKNYGFCSIHDTSGFTVQNSIFYRNGNNYTVDTAELIKDVYSQIAISNTITEVYNNSGALIADPKFIDTANVVGGDGKYFTTDDGLRLLNPCSPAINAGNNSFVAGINVDVSGATRIKNGIVDLGAYEVQEAIGIAASVIYVKKNATGLNNGSSWQDAFTDLQSAFKRCSDTIKVAKGIYPVSSSDQRASFVMNNNRVIMGGYPDFGSPTNNDINTELYPSKLDGLISSNVKCYNVVVSNNNDSTARIIGFEIMNSASPEPFGYLNNATIKIVRKSSPYLEKIKLNSLTNQAQYLLYIYDVSKPKFYNCAFYNGFTSAGSLDGLRTIYIGNSSDPLFFGSYIGKDTTVTTTTSDFGAKFLFTNSGGTIDNCTFSLATLNAITNQNSNTRIQNCIFTKALGRSIYNINSTSVISNCVFPDPAILSANYDGGAVFNNSGSVTLIDKCRFYNSYADNNGSAIANENGSATTIKNSLFKTGRNWSGPSPLYNNAGTIKVINCLSYFTPSYIANFAPPAIFLKSTGGSNSTIINSTIISALSGNNSNVIATNNATDTLKLYNSILWRYGDYKSLDLNGIDVLTFDNNNINICDIRNSILFRQTNTALTNTLVGINPRLINLEIPEGVDNVFYSADDGLSLCTCSPAINAGNNSLNAETFDILGASRVFNGTIDMGAYELPNNATTDKTFFVKQNVAAGGSGLTWASAYNSLQKAVLNNCADTIKISKGTYKPSLASRDSSFNIYRGVTLLGAYPDAGNPTEQNRDVVANPTILSGDIGILNDSTDNTANILSIHCPDTTVKLDGLIIERGNADKIMPYPQNSGKTVRGGGIYAMANKFLSINNCIIRNNYGQSGGGLYFQGTTIDINKSEFSNNNAADGGGFYAENTFALPGNTPSGVPVSFRNSVFNSNKGRAGTCGTAGGTSGLNNFLFENLIVYKNEGSVGAGFFFSSLSSGTIRNCIFAKNKNTTSNPGVGISLFNQFAQNNIFINTQNCIFAGNNVMGATAGYTNIDFNWKNTSSQPTAAIPFPNLVWSAVSPGQTAPANSGIINNTGVSLVDINNGPGPDNLWRTIDDGLRPTPCSNTVNKGNNTYVQGLPFDILDSTRIINTTVDMGPYELSSSTTTNPVATITASDTTICTGTSVTFNATMPGANANTVYQWMVNSANAGTNSATFTTNSLVNNDTVKVVITINNTCANTQIVTSNAIIIHVNAVLTASVTISASANPSCTGGQVIYTATPVNGGATANYQWKRNGVNAGTNSTTFIPAPLNNNDVISVVMTSSLNCVTSNPVTSNSITQTVNTFSTPSVTITNSAVGCPGSPITFTANPVNGGPNPNYQWNVNGLSAGTNSPTFTSATLNEDDDVVVVMIVNAQCSSPGQVISQHYIVHFSYTGVASVAITSTAIGCPGTSITFTASPTNGGATPAYQWKVNAGNVGTNSPTFTSTTLNENDVVTVVMTSNSPCVSTTVVTSPSIVVHFSSSIAASVSVTTTAIGCPGTSITFTANPVNGGTTPAYQWKVNGGNVGTNSPTYTSTTLNENDVVNVVMTSNASCVTTTVVTSPSIVIHFTASVTASVSITSTTIGCPGTSISFTANPVNGGTTPAYQWKVNGGNVGTNSPTYTSSTLNENDVVTVVMTSNASCVTITVVTSPPLVVHFATPVTASVSITSTTIGCVGTSITFTATPVNGGTAPAYQWKVNGGNVGTNSPNYTSSTLNENDVVTVVMTSNAGCVTTTVVTSLPLVVHFATPVAASVNFTSTPIGCTGSSITFTATAVNGGTTPSYQWKVNNINVGTNSNTFSSSTLNNNDVIKVVLTSSIPCATPDSVSMTISVLPGVVANAGNDVVICAGSSTQLQGTGGTIYSWSPAAGLSNPNIANPIASPAVTTSYILTVSNGSTCSAKDTVVVTVNTATAPAVSISTASNNICLGTAVTFSASATNGGSNPIYQWRANGNTVGTNSSSFTSSALANNDVVKVVLYSSNTCAVPDTAVSNVITMSVSQLATPLLSLNNRTYTVTNPEPAATYTWQLKTNNVWNDVVPTATGAVFTATTGGEYRVKAVNGGCTKYSASQLTARDPDLFNHPFGIYLYPNPTTGTITIDSIRLAEKWETLDIVSIDGRSILTTNIKNKTEINIDLSMLGSGTYFAILKKIDGIFYAVKFVKL